MSSRHHGSHERPSPHRSGILGRIGRLIWRNLIVFLILCAAIVALFLAYLRSGAPQTKAVIVAAGALVVTLAGVYAVAPGAFESRSERARVIELLSAGLSIVLVYRIAFGVLQVGAEPNQKYSLVAWVLAALAVQGATLVVSAVIVSRNERHPVRSVMALFAVTGLGLAVAAEATRIVDLGFTAGRWGLVPVGAAFAFDPVPAVPFHTITAAVLGWGWARSAKTKRPTFVATALGVVAVLTGAFNRALAGDPFSGFPILFVALVLWAWLFKKSSGGQPMVPPPPKAG